MKKIIALFILAGITNFSTAQQLEKLSGKLTLRQCIEKAIANNLQVRQAAYQSQLEKSNYDMSKGAQLPFISGNVNHGINQGRSIDPFTNSYVTQSIGFANYSINAGITLWNGSAAQNTIKQSQLNHQASEMNWQQAKDNIAINVVLAYLQILTNQEQLVIAEKQLIVTQNQVDRLTTQNNAGAIAPALLYDIRGQLHNDEINIINTKLNLENAKLLLAQLMNVVYDPEITFERLQDNLTSLTDNREVIYEKATQQLAMVKVAELRQQSAAKGVAVAKALRLPSVSLNGGLGTNYSSIATSNVLLSTIDKATEKYVTVNNTKIPVFAPSDSYQSNKIGYTNQLKNNFNSFIGIGVQIPILNGFQAKNRIRQATIIEQRANFEATSTKTQLKQTVDQNYVIMEAARDRFQAITRQVAAYTASFSAAEARFNAGASTIVDYVISKNNLDRANANLVAAKYDYLLRIKILQFYQGKDTW